jgi:hypothetical protein
MKQIKKIALLMFTSAIVISCDPMYYKDDRHSYITLENNSENDIYVYGTINYPDTTISKSYLTSVEFGRVNSGISNYVIPSSLGDWWEKIFKIRDLQYISIFIFDAAFLEPHMYDKNFTVNETMALQRYDLSLQNLNDLNWKISYPPDERMKGMKMYPPYKE